MTLLPTYPKFLAVRQSCSSPFVSFRSCQIASIAYFPAAFASIGILDLAYLAPSACFVYSTPKSLSRSNTPKTRADTLLLADAILYALTTPAADSIDGISSVGFNFRFFSKLAKILRSEERRVG